MSLRKSKIRTWNAWTLFVLSLVAVAAPTWANAYICPMARAVQTHEDAESASCCSKAPAAPAHASTGKAYEIPCHCAQLQWDVAGFDHPRAQIFAPAVWAVQPAPLFQVSWAHAPDLSRPTSDAPPDSSSPPLWVLHQSIRC